MHLDYADVAYRISIWALSLCGGVSLLVHEGVPRVVGYLMDYVLRHPAGRAALLKWEPYVLEAIEDAKGEVKKRIDSARVVPDVPGTPPIS